MRNTANSSESLTKPELVESKATTVTGANREQKRLFDFSMRLTVKRPQAKAAAAAVPASGAASAAAAKKV
jgi:type IV pilus assembly protein PilN